MNQNKELPAKNKIPNLVVKRSAEKKKVSLFSIFFRIKLKCKIILHYLLTWQKIPKGRRQNYLPKRLIISTSLLKSCRCNTSIYYATREIRTNFRC